MKFPSWDATATDAETLEVLAALIRLQKPSVVVEAGTYRGHGALYMAAALEANGRGILWTADPVDHGQGEALEGVRNVHVCRYDFLDLLAWLSVVDFAFIDASGPGPDGAALRWLHFEAVRANMNPGGMICVHDTAADDWSDGEGGRSVLRIREACQLNLTSGRGLSVCLC
jgi:predicted O-methyltransferase YrrM